MFVLGPGVRGGFYGEELSLADLDMDNLKFNTDFRSVYATMLERIVGVDSKLALGRSWPTIDRV